MSFQSLLSACGIFTTSSGPFQRLLCTLQMEVRHLCSELHTSEMCSLHISARDDRFKLLSLKMLVLFCHPSLLYFHIEYSLWGYWTCSSCYGQMQKPWLSWPYEWYVLSYFPYDRPAPNTPRVHPLSAISFPCHIKGCPHFLWLSCAIISGICDDLMIYVLWLYQGYLLSPWVLCQTMWTSMFLLLHHVPDLSCIISNPGHRPDHSSKNLHVLYLEKK